MRSPRIFAGQAVLGESLTHSLSRVYGSSPEKRDKLWEGRGEIPPPDPIVANLKIKITLINNEDIWLKFKDQI